MMTVEPVGRVTRLDVALTESWEYEGVGWNPPMDAENNPEILPGFIAVKSGPELSPPTGTTP
jgi:hypothetical protein